ncbi:FAD-dependent oxidoreductase [Bailinhaonella thermotolerans]|nr:NAD(P)/FAD-dependent oxidoreductase [Bailinhaonella thermotolerans]
MSIHVLVVGAGIGGLCLAQGLRMTGVRVTVFERSRERTDWLQGYRIHINPPGAAALRDCLPSHLWETFERTASRPSTGFGFVDEKLRDLVFLEEDLFSGTHYGISRITLRKVLLEGLDDVVRFGKEYERYTIGDDGRVTAHFTDGTSETGDVLIAADGSNSRVRAQYLPHAQRMDTGVIAIAGKLPLTAETRAQLPPRLLTGPNNILPARSSAMFTALWETPESERAELSEYTDTGDYLFWAYSTSAARLPGDVERMAPEALRDLVHGKTDGWSPALREVVAASDPATINAIRLRSMDPDLKPWRPSQVTLLGDAIHNMTPMAGIGANTALRDAAVLKSRLVEVDAGRKPLLTAVGEYETRMRGYAFAAVRESLRNARQSASDARLPRAAFTTALRLANAVPSLKRRMFADMGQ